MQSELFSFSHGMKQFIFISLIFVAQLSYSQNNTNELYYGLGYGSIKDGWGDIPGQAFYLSGHHSTKKSWLSFSGRIVGTIIERTTAYGTDETFEKSNGMNLEADVNFHLRIWRFNIYPSGGISLRFSSNQHITTMSYWTTASGQIYDFEVNYDQQNSIQPGYTLGLNVDAIVTRNLIFGIRFAGMGYFGNEFGSITINVKNKNWKL